MTSRTGRAGRRVGAILLALVPLVAVGADLYVDSKLGTTGGTGPFDSPLKTIRAALDASGAGDTIWVRGGEDRSYAIAGEADTLPIPETKEGLSIRAWGGDVRVAIAADYAVNIYSNSTPVVSNAAANVMIQGLHFLFSKESFGKHVTGKTLGKSCSLIKNMAPCLTLSRCTFELIGELPDGTYSKTLDAFLVTCDSLPATNLFVEGCSFFNCRKSSRDTDCTLFRVRDNASFVGNVFSNVQSVLTGIQLTGDICTGPASFVSNLVYQAGGEGTRGVITAAYVGPRKIEVAYNRFVNQGDEPWGAVLRKGREAYQNGLDFHHNTVVGFDSFIRADALQYAASFIKARIFNNILILSTNATHVIENSEGPIHGYLSESNWQPTMFRRGSFYSNNALLTGEFTGGTATTLQHERWHYDITAGLAISNTYVLSSAFSVPAGATILSPPPVFANTNNLYHANFYRPREKRVMEGVNYGRIGWTGEDGEYPQYIGALPPLYPMEIILKLR